MSRAYENGPEGMPRVERMPQAVLDCLIRHSLFALLANRYVESEDMDRLYGLMHDVAEEVLARVSLPAALSRRPAAALVPDVDNVPCHKCGATDWHVCRPAAAPEDSQQQDSGSCIPAMLAGPAGNYPLADQLIAGLADRKLQELWAMCAYWGPVEQRAIPFARAAIRAAVAMLEQTSTAGAAKGGMTNQPETSAATPLPVAEPVDCEWCAGKGQYRQTYTVGCGFGSYACMGPCDHCKGTGKVAAIDAAKAKGGAQ